MASVIAPLLVFIVSCICAGHAEFVKVQCKTENTGQFGQQSLLECVVKISQEAEDPEVLFVAWRKQGVETTLLVFDTGKLSNEPGYAFAEPLWDERNMNVSLLITNTTVEHEGTYTCEVFTDRGDSAATTNLAVTAKYNHPTVSSIPESFRQGDEATLVCHCDGGYPKGQLRWLVESTTDWTNGSVMREKRANSGLYRLSSELRLKGGSTFSTYTCVAYNGSGGREGTAIFEVPNERQWRDFWARGLHDRVGESRQVQAGSGQA